MRSSPRFSDAWRPIVSWWRNQEDACKHLDVGAILWVGRQGSGKSLLAFMESVDQRAPIYSNVSFSPALARTVTLWDSIEAIGKAEHVVMYMDEVGEVMNSHEWQTVDKNVRNRLIELRKFHVRLEMTAQKIRQADVSLKNIVWEVRFPKEVSFPFIGWFFWDSRRKDMRCSVGSLLRRGDRVWWKTMFGFGTFYVWRSCTLEEAEGYFTNLSGEEGKAHKNAPGAVRGWRLFSQRLADLYDSRHSVAQNFDFNRSTKKGR